MNIPAGIAWEIGLLLAGFVFGTLWGHHTAIGKRVTYMECERKRENCPCLAELKNFQAHEKGTPSGRERA